MGDSERGQTLLLKRLRELDQELAENERVLWELKKQQAMHLPLENQLAFNLQEHLHRSSRSNVPLLAANLRRY